jgi:hypothetical protein
MKRVRENKRREKAARKRERRLERKQRKNSPGDDEFDDDQEPRPTFSFSGEDELPDEKLDPMDETVTVREPAPSANDDH